MAVTSFVLSLLLWSFLPRAATNRIYASIAPVFFKHIPANDPRHARNWRIVFTVVVLSYLAYSVVQVERGLPQNFYRILGLSPNTFDPKALKANYRALSLTFHPDKNPGFNDHYVLIRKAYDVLKDPVSKSVYDRLGLEVLEGCATCKTWKSFLYKSLTPTVLYYAATSFFLAVYSFLGQDKFGSFWRVVALSATATIELMLVVKPVDIFASTLAPWRTTRERIAILHQLFVVVSIAVGQIGPVWFPPEEEVAVRLLADAENLSVLALGEARTEFADALTPYAASREALQRVVSDAEKTVLAAQLKDAAAQAE
ncbi:hypothetical protein HDU84_000624 [Entophlyctis sp. JEL0112]|nr:hypothetical protein HDU84_000624 [Entophlyctis sp. JEL0112]